MHGFDLRAAELELAAGLERNGAAAGDVEQADDVRPFHDRLPAEQVFHAFEQRTDAAVAFVGHRTMTFEREGEFLVLGADAELRFRFDALRNPIDEIVAPFDRRQVDLVTRHAGSRRKKVATLHTGRGKAQCDFDAAHAAARRACGGKRR